MSWSKMLATGMGLFLAMWANEVLAQSTSHLQASHTLPIVRPGSPQKTQPTQSRSDVASAQAEKPVEAPKSRAIVVGISDYDNYASLDGAAPDALKLQEALTALHFETPTVLAISGTKLEKVDLVKKLKEIASACHENDLLLFYFAGHGSRRPNKKGVQKDYLLLSTTKQDTDQMFEDTAFALGSEGLKNPQDSLEGILKTCKARRRVIIIDACRNTAARAAGQNPFPHGLDEKFKDRVDQVVRMAPAGSKVEAAVLYACSPGETSKEFTEKKAGIFTLPLVAALKGEARDQKGRVTLSSVLKYVSQNIFKVDGKPVQQPMLYGDTEMELGVFKEAVITVISSKNATDGSALVWVPDATEFQVGTSETERANLLEGLSATEQNRLKAAFENAPVREKIGKIQGFWIYQNLVTVGQFKKFLTAVKSEDILWPKAPSLEAYQNWHDDAMPMVNVPLEVAQKYAEWAGGDLPTDAEWELAARGPQRRIYPWGDTFDATRAHSSVGVKPADGPAKSGTYPQGASPYGAYDMAGNLWQWCKLTKAKGCLHGGSWKETDPMFLSSAYCREEFDSIRNDDVIGFRVVLRKNPPPSSP